MSKKKIFPDVYVLTGRYTNEDGTPYGERQMYCLCATKEVAEKCIKKYKKVMTDWFIETWAVKTVP